MYVAYRQFESTRGHQESSIQYVVSTDGGATFSKPRPRREFEPYDAADSAGDPEAAEQAHEQAFENADGPESEAGEESVGDSRDCGSGPFACQSGFVFFRHDSQPRITADPKAADQNVYLVYDATVPAPSRPSRPRTTRPTRRAARCASVRAGSTSPRSSGSGAWSTPRLLAPGRAVTSSSPTSTPTAESCTRSGTTAATTRPTASSTRRATTAPSETPPASPQRRTASTPTPHRRPNGGASWALARLSGASQMPNYEMFGDRRVPFHGDYNYVSSVGSFAFNTWTDTRQVVARRRPALRRRRRLRRPPVPHPGRRRHLVGRTPAPMPAVSTRTSTAPPPLADVRPFGVSRPQPGAAIPRRFHRVPAPTVLESHP